MNWLKRHTADERGLLHVSQKKKKRAKKEPFSVRDYFHKLWKTMEDEFENNFEDFALDEWQWDQRRRIRGSGIARLEEWLKQGIHDTLYARRILRKTKQR